MKKISFLLLGIWFCFSSIVANAYILNKNEEFFKNAVRESIKDEIQYFQKLKTCSPNVYIDKEDNSKSVVVGRTKNGMCRYYDNYPDKRVECLFPKSVTIGLSTTILDGMDYAFEGNKELFSERFKQFIEIVKLANDYCTVIKK